ncbi:MAG: hypothetical protein K9N11_05015 [Lentisphaeria bacterium]|nr:hypothetical protein [Candidatus Neomarinimicrobiota bacterium]MCF7842194.1 hypothetical protein [Lentisphaeria bacterium]
MKPEAIKTAFEELAEKLGYTVRYEKGDFRGGACRVDRDRQIIINSAAPLNHQNYAFARVFAEMNPDLIEQHFLLPELRKMLDDIRTENQRREAMENHALD